MWKCEFCNQNNEVHIEDEEFPQSNEVTYLLEAAAQIQQAEEEQKAAAEIETPSDNISVIFCIDVSSSMASQNRLEMCKQAIAAQINSMASSNGQRKLGLVAFDHNVEIIGDGVEKSKTIDQNLLNDYNQLLATGE